jgi:hypothetical protein
MATCAACDRPLHREQGVAIVGTEVFHKACVRAVGTERSRLNRVIAESEQVRGFLERQLAEALQHGASLANHAVRLKEIVEEAHVKYQRLELQMSTLRSQNRFLERQHEDSQLAVHRLVSAVNIATAQRDAAVNEAALHQTINRGAPPRAVEVEREQPVDDRDDAEQRFSLLELDIK